MVDQQLIQGHMESKRKYLVFFINSFKFGQCCSVPLCVCGFSASDPSLRWVTPSSGSVSRRVAKDTADWWLWWLDSCHPTNSERFRTFTYYYVAHLWHDRQICLYHGWLQIHRPRLKILALESVHNSPKCSSTCGLKKPGKSITWNFGSYLPTHQRPKGSCNGN